MSLDEVVAVLKANDEKIKRDYELTRLQCFYSATAMGNKTTSGVIIDRPDKLFKFPWEKGKAAVPAPKTQKDAMKKLLSYGTKKS